MIQLLYTHNVYTVSQKGDTIGLLLSLSSTNTQYDRLLTS